MKELAISLIDKKGNVLAAKSKESYKKGFRQTLDGDKVRCNFGCGNPQFGKGSKRSVWRPQAIITIHKNCKLMLLPIPSYEILVGLVLQRDYNIISKIERLSETA